MLAGLLSGREVTSFTEAQHHVEEAVALPAVGDRIMLALDGADANAAEREDAGLDRGIADKFDHRGHVDESIDISGIFDREMRHGEIAPHSLSSKVTAHGAIRSIIGLDRVAFAGLDRADE